MSIVRNIGVVVAVAGCALIALSSTRRAAVARQRSKARTPVSQRAVDREARASELDEQRWADDGGVWHGAADRAAGVDAARQTNSFQLDYKGR